MTVPRAMRVSLLLVVVDVCADLRGRCRLPCPIAQVANRDLAVSLSAFVPAPVTVAFVVGGSAFALLTTLNAAVGCMAYPGRLGLRGRMVAARTGRAFRSDRAPVAPLSGGHDRRGVPLIAGNSAKTVSSSVTILMIVVQAMVAVAALRLILRDGSSLCAFRSLPLLGRVPAIRARGVVHRRAARRPAADRMAAVHDEPSADHRQCRDIRHNGCRRCHREQI